MFVETKREGEVAPRIATPRRIKAWQKFLLDGADLMERRGQCRGSAMGPDGSVCLVAAIVKAHRLRLWTGFRAFNAMADYLGSCPIKFNDTHTGPEVIAAMRACARSEQP